MSHLNVVELPVTNLNDIPLQLRRLADRIEKGEVGELSTCLVVVNSEGNGIASFCFGDNPSRFEVGGILTKAAYLALRHEEEL